jgi:signal transduction histidine kinase
MDAGHEEAPRAPSAGVLVVEDDAPTLAALRALLTPIAAVTEATSGDRALAHLARQDFAVVVLDAPVNGIDGLAIARRIRAGACNPQVPIVLLTAVEGGATRILDGGVSGVVDYLAAPFEPALLRAKVSILVELHQCREQLKRESAARLQVEAERAATVQAERNKDQFLAALSHELRTPLTSILLWSDMLLHKPLPPETVRRGLETIDLCARYEAHIVERVLEMSRLITGTLSLEVAPLELGEVIADAASDVATLAAERKVRIVSPAARLGLCVLGDWARLRQVVYNLLENAVTFTPAGGRVDVTLEQDPSTVRIRVRDNGAGFSPEAASTLFSRFQQRNWSSTRARGGLGIGLALTKALIELHGGTITAASEGLGQGATFVVTLPRGRQAPTDRAA